MSVNGNNDKQWRRKLINVVRPVLLIPLSFTFDNRQRTTAVTFSTLNPRHLSLSLSLALCLLNNNCIVCASGLLPVWLRLVFYLYTVKAIELDEDAL